MKPKLYLVLFTFVFIFIPLSVFAVDETLTVTTYYPSPYGSYNEFRVASNTYLAYSSGNVGIGTTNPTSKLQVVGLPVYANNAAAIAGGLTAGALYRTGSDPDQVCVVH
jgi:hypothetical protein